MTPLLILASDASKEAISVAKLLMHYRADLNITNESGYSALALCVIHENIEFAKLLM
jgi:ankyrin repeat protein